jgi:hypothetical protein
MLAAAVAISMTAISCGSDSQPHQASPQAATGSPAPAAAPADLNVLTLQGAITDRVNASASGPNNGVLCSQSVTEGQQMFTIVIAGSGKSRTYYAANFNGTGSGDVLHAGAGAGLLPNSASLTVAADRIHGESYVSSDATLTMDPTRTSGTMKGTFQGKLGTVILSVAWRCTADAGGSSPP